MDAKLHDAIEGLVREFTERVTRLVADAIVEEVQAALRRGAREPRAAAPAGVRARRERRAAAGPVERWVPDRRARRVPKFVVEATGLDTKKAIVERFGEHAIFQKGEPAPPPLRSA